MRVRIGNGLLPLNLLTIILVVVIIFLPSNILRIILGLPFVLFFPGYILVVALFPSLARQTATTKPICPQPITEILICPLPSRQETPLLL